MYHLEVFNQSSKTFIVYEYMRWFYRDFAFVNYSTNWCEELEEIRVIWDLSYEILSSKIC